MLQDYSAKLEHIRGAVAHHVCEEEGNWCIDLKKKAEMADQSKLTTRYKEEFDRNMGTEAMGMKQTAGGSSCERQATRCWPFSFEEHC